MNIRMNLSKTLKKAKMLSGLKYADLIEMTGLSRTAINKALNGGKGTGIDTFQKLFDACDCSVEIELTDKENGLY